MAEQIRWVTKAEAARELDMSLSTLDRQIRRGEIEIRREGRRVYVRMEGPEYVSDDELLRQALVREDKLQRTVWELDRTVTGLKREQDEVRESESASRLGYDEMEEAYRKEQAAHKKTRRLAIRLGVAVVALLVIVGLLTWQLLAGTLGIRLETTTYPTAMPSLDSADVSFGRGRVRFVPSRVS